MGEPVDRRIRVAGVLLFLPYLLKRVAELTHPGWVEWLAADYGARVIMLAGALVARPALRKDFRPVLRGWRFIALTFAVISTSFFVSLVIDPLVYRALEGPWFQAAAFPRIADKTAHLLDLFLGLWLVALSEELAFRWFLVRSLEQQGARPKVVILVSALVFAAAHATRGLQVIGFALLYGALYAFFYQRTGRLWPLVFCHYAIDFIAFSRLTALFYS